MGFEENPRTVIFVMIAVTLILYGGDTQGLMIYFFLPMLFLGIVFGVPLAMLWYYDERLQT
jgi:hypothetical protein